LLTNSMESHDSFQGPPRHLVCSEALCHNVNLGESKYSNTSYTDHMNLIAAQTVNPPSEPHALKTACGAGMVATRNARNPILASHGHQGSNCSISKAFYRVCHLETMALGN
jgi:hypothetical protein